MKSKPRRTGNAELRAKSGQGKTELIFFLGKGGVGKTTIAAAYACWRAHSNRRQRVLLLSTDPAHSLGAVLDRKLPPKLIAVSISKRAQLAVHEIDAEQRFRKFLDRYREPLIAAIESGTVFTREEIQPLLSSTLPGMAEMAGLLAIDDALQSGRFDCVVVDTAPFGHTLRLFQLPESFQKLLRFLEISSSRDAILAAHFGGRVPAPSPLLGEWRQILESLLIDLRQRARLVLVTTPEMFALQESLRVGALMRAMSPPLQFEELVLNRMVDRDSRCPTCKAQYREGMGARALLRREFPRLPLRHAPDDGAPILGPARLVRLGQQVFGDHGRQFKALAPRMTSKLRLLPAAWPDVPQQLAITVGKGGVGKTTVSAAMAVHLRTANKTQVAVCSTDPAPSLDDVFEQPVDGELRPMGDDPGMLAAEIDAPAAFHAWAAQMKEKISDVLSTKSGGVHVDLWFERLLFEALLDVVPPGLDEVFGVLHLSTLLGPNRTRRGSEGGQFKLILDMAPTGHALELLRTPERILHWSRLLLKSLAAHRKLPFARDAGAEIAQFASNVRGLAGRLHDRSGTAAWVVMLAEPLPDRETERLIRELRALQVPIAGLIVNRLLMVRGDRCPRCRLRQTWQFASLGRLKNAAFRDTPLYALPELTRPISGRAALERLTKELRRLS